MTVNSHEALYQYLNNRHHMSTTQLLTCMEELPHDNLSAIPTEYKNQLSLRLDTDNTNADLFYPKKVANQVHQLARDIQQQKPLYGAFYFLLLLTYLFLLTT